MKLIKKAQEKEIEFKIGQFILAGKWLPLQNIGTTLKYFPAKVLKVNRVSLNVETENGDIYRVPKRDCKAF
jgi:hypothetical protein